MKLSDLIKRSWNSIWRNKYRSVITMISVAIGTLSMIIMISIGVGLKEGIVDNYISDNNLLKITASNKSGMESSDAVFNKLREIGDVLGVEKASVAGVVDFIGRVTIDGKKTECKVVAIDEATLKSMDNFISAGSALKSGDGIIVSNGMSQMVGKDGRIIVNDRTTMEKQAEVKLHVDGNLKGDEPFLIDTISKNTDGSYPQIIYIPIERVYRLNNKNFWMKFVNFEIMASDMKNVDEVISYLENNNYTVKSVYAEAAEIRKIFLYVEAVLGCLGAITLIIASINTANIMNISVVERKKEIGILKAVGMKPRNIKGMFRMEALDIGVIGAILGTILSWPVEEIINYIFKSNVPYIVFNTDRLVKVSYMAILSACIITIFITMASSNHAVKKASKLEMLAVLREE